MGRKNSSSYIANNINDYHIYAILPTNYSDKPYNFFYEPRDQHHNNRSHVSLYQKTVEQRYYMQMRGYKRYQVINIK